MKKTILSLIIITTLIGCGAYGHFQEVILGDAKTIQIDFFPNQASFSQNLQL